MVFIWFSYGFHMVNNRVPEMVIPQKLAGLFHGRSQKWMIA
jgi:hypothetical protein